MRLTILLPLLSWAAACATPQQEPSTTAPDCEAPSTFVAHRAAAAPEDVRNELLAWSPRTSASSEAQPYVERAARDHLDSCGLRASIQLTAELVKFRTVRAKYAPTEADFVRMEEFLSAWSETRGFSFTRIGDADAWEVGFGPKAEIARTTFMMHGDVVPVATAPKGEPHGASAEIPKGWSVPAFEVTEKDGRLYGRGTEDDKGPIASVLTVMDTMRQFGLRPKKRITALIGTGEEFDWSGMVSLSKARRPGAFIISLDANFPVVIAESGFVAWHLHIPHEKDERAKPNCVVVENVTAGEFLTQVPGSASALLRPTGGLTIEDLAKLTESAVARESSVRGSEYSILSKPRDDAIFVEVGGSAVHSSEAHKGHNAVWALSGLAARLPLCSDPAAIALRLIGSRFDGDHWGERLGIGYQDKLMGRLLVSPTLVRTSSNGVDISVNMRRPRGKSSSEFASALDHALARIQAEVSPRIVAGKKRYVGEPAVADTNGPLTQTLLGIYRELANKPDAKPLSIRGGTYARLFRGAVSFGPAIPGRPYRGHAPDEYMEVEALELLNRAVFEAARRLDALETE